MSAYDRSNEKVNPSYPQVTGIYRWLDGFTDIPDVKLDLGFRAGSLPADRVHDIATPEGISRHIAVTASHPQSWITSLDSPLTVFLAEERVAASIAQSQRHLNSCSRSGLTSIIERETNQILKQPDERWTEDYEILRDPSKDWDCGRTITAVSKMKPTLSAEVHFCGRDSSAGYSLCEASTRHGSRLGTRRWKHPRRTGKTSKRW